MVSKRKKAPVARRKRPTPKPARKDVAEKAEIRLLLQSRSEITTAAVAARLRGILNRVVKVELLYGKAGSRTGNGSKAKSTEFLARIPVKSAEEGSSRAAFDIAHTVRDMSNGEFIWVEPDVLQAPTVGFSDAGVASATGSPAEAAGFGDILGRICNENTEPPADKYWHLRRMNVQQAWDFSATSGAQSRGLGIRIGHLDTGWTTHPDLFPSLDLNGQFDFVDNDGDAKDPEAKGNPFHGSRTGSVIASPFGGDLPGATAPFNGDLSGVAPAAKLVPVRVVKRVIVFFNGDVVRGIRHAATNDCHVISMSLGGAGGKTLRDAVRHAVNQNVIVCAASGNCVGKVVEPASFPETIAVAATNCRNRPWKGSCRGESVDISAPGAQVWTASRPTASEPRPVSQGEGTSFAVAAVAGIAALWLAHHDRDLLINRYKPRNVLLQYVFRHILSRTAKDIGLPKNEFGAGFVDAEAVIRFPLPAADDVMSGSGAAIGGRDPFDASFANLLGPMPPFMAEIATASMRSGESVAERELLAQEFAQICFDHPNAHDAWRRGLILATSELAVGGDASALLDAGGIAKYASQRLRNRLIRP